MKTFNDLMDAAEERLSKNLGLNFYPGDIARSLIEIINAEFAEFYETLDYNLTMLFVSRAEGETLDSLGTLLNCQRYKDEEDDNYRYRIIHQVEVVAGCNETALRLTLLGVPGVRDVVMRRFTRGAGSFSIMIVPEVTGDISDELIQNAQAVLDESEGFGIYGAIIAPTILSIDIKIQLICTGNKESLVIQARHVVWDYIANLPAGGTIIISDIIQQIKNLSDNIKDIQISELHANGSPLLIVNQESSWDEVFQPNTIDIVA